MKDKVTTPTKTSRDENDSFENDSDDDTTPKEDQPDDASESRENHVSEIVKIKIKPGLDSDTEKENEKNTQDTLNELKNAAYCNDNSDDDIVDPTDTEGEEEE